MLQTFGVGYLLASHCPILKEIIKDRADFELVKSKLEELHQNPSSVASVSSLPCCPALVMMLTALFNQYAPREIARNLPSQVQARHEETMNEAASALEGVHIQHCLPLHLLTNRQRAIYQV